MIVNPLFSKANKEFNSILKNQTEIPNENVAKCSSRNPNFKLVWKTGKFPDARQKPAKSI